MSEYNLRHPMDRYTMRRHCQHKHFMDEASGCDPRSVPCQLNYPFFPGNEITKGLTAKAQRDATARAIAEWIEDDRWAMPNRPPEDY